jgi:branched-chain amino acid transport system permease protein
MKKTGPLHFIAAGILFLLPIILSSFGVKIMTEVFITSIFVLSLALIIGYAGLGTLGHAGFFCIGSYCVAILGKYIGNTYILLLTAIVVAGLIAWVSGLLFIRTSGHYFLMITVAFGSMVYAFFYKMTDLSGGPDGMSVSVRMNLGFGNITSSLGRYYVMVSILVLCFAFLYFFIKSPAGKAIIGVKENESRMKALGYDTLYYKILAYVIAGMMAGLAGGLNAYNNMFVSPDSGNMFFSATGIVMLIVGGVGTLIGAPIGTAFFVILQNYISTYTERWPLIMGLIFIILILYKQGGVAHLLIKIWIRMSPKPVITPSLEARGVEEQPGRK